MHRRDFLKAASATALMASPSIVRAQTSQKTLRFVPQSDLAALDPVWTTAYVTRNHAHMVFDSLYGLDASFTAVPQMVDGHVVENDGKLWRLTLRDGLRFHDGEPVLARDAIASIRRWAAKDAFGAQLLSITDELSAPSDKVIQFRLQKPFPSLPFAMARGSLFMLPIMPERLAKTSAFDAVPEVVGSGPFQYAANERVPGSLNVYKRFDKYVPRPSGEPSFTAGPKVAYLDRVEWMTIPDASTAASALNSGEVDWWEQATPDLLPLFQSSKDITISKGDRTGTIGFLRLNHLYPPFDNPAVRRVVLRAITQKDYMTALAGDDPSMSRDHVGVFAPGTPMATDVGVDVLSQPHDFNALRKELTEAGYKGEKVVFLASTDIATSNALCEVAADMFRKLGMNVDYQATDWGTVNQRRTSQAEPSKGGWNAYVATASGFDYSNPGGYLNLRGNGREGYAGWPTSPELERLRFAWFDAPDLTAQKQICEEIQKQAWIDVPIIPLGQYFQPFAYRNTISGIPAGPFTLFYNVKKA